MKRKVLALMLIFAMTLSIAACKTTDDEENAVADEVVSDNGSDNQDDNNDTNQPDDNDTNEPDNSNDNDNNDDDEDNTPPLSTEGKYTVTFDYGYDGKTQNEKTSGTVTEINPTRNGFTFDGWYNGNDKWSFSTKVTEDMTLTAKWTALTYKITYKANGATLPSGNPTSYSADHPTITLKPATKKYRTFKGWMKEGDDGSTSTMSSIPTGTTGDLVLVPLFDESTLCLGSYEQDGDSKNGKETIEWIFIREENGKSLYMSKYILDAKPYQDPKKDVSWSTCTLRKWLNDSFLRNAFSTEDKAVIVYSDIHTPVNFQTKVGTAVDTKDYVFILSLEEAEQYTNWGQRKAKVTSYAVSQGAIQSGAGTSDWWLRSAGYYNNYAALVQQNSGIREGGYSVSMTTIGVRPCIWVDNSKLK